MPGNWDQYQPLNNGKVVWPTGPLTGITDQPTWLQAWVVQGGPDTQSTTIYPGATQSAGQSNWTGWTVPNRWIASEPGWANGNLSQGPAVGIAVLALYNKNTNTHEYEWWVDDIVLY